MIARTRQSILGTSAVRVLEIDLKEAEKNLGAGSGSIPGIARDEAASVFASSSIELD